jgi:hypothetical protein
MTVRRRDLRCHDDGAGHGRTALLHVSRIRGAGHVAGPISQRRLSDMVNIARAQDAAMLIALHELDTPKSGAGPPMRSGQRGCCIELPDGQKPSIAAAVTCFLRRPTIPTGRRAGQNSWRRGGVASATFLASSTRVCTRVNA